MPRNTRPSFASNTLRAKPLFKERNHYKRNVLRQDEYRNLIDIWDPRYQNYGKVDLQNQSIRLDTRFLKPINPKSKDEKFYAVNFVTDAFLDLRRYCFGAGERGTAAPVIPKESRYFKINAKTQNQWVPLDTPYREHLRRVFDPFVKTYLQAPRLRKRSLNIDDFLRVFLEFSADFSSDFPLTKTGFVESKHGPANHNGLLIEIDEKKSHDKDLEKAKWINDVGFPFWLRGCAMHGFLVDRNAPWRIMANLESQSMGRYYKEYGIRSMRQLFDTYFVPTYLDDLQDLKMNLYSFYRTYVRMEPFVVEKEFLVNYRQTVTTNVYRQLPSRDAFLEMYGDRFWLRYWFLLRSRELDTKFSDREQFDTLKTAYKIHKELDLQSALAYIVRVLHRRAGRGGLPEKSFIRREGDRQIIVKT